MRKICALTGAVAVGLLAPATVQAATKDYAGTFESGGTLAFELKKTNKGKKVVGFAFEEFPVKCASGPNTASGSIGFPIKVKRGRFQAEAIAGENPSKPKAKLTLTGKLKGGGNAKGTLKLRGSRLNVDNPPARGRDDCTSPITSWTASTIK